MKFEIFSPTPPNEVLYIADLIKDKIVCDIGEGDKKWSKEMAEFAKEVRGIEIDPQFTDKPQDFLEADFLGIDVLYINMGEQGTLELGKKLKREKWKGIVISYGNPLYLGTIPYEKRFTFLIYKL